MDKSKIIREIADKLEEEGRFIWRKKDITKGDAWIQAADWLRDQADK